MKKLFGLVSFLLSGAAVAAATPFIFSGTSIQSLVPFADGPVRIQSQLLYSDPALPILWGGTGQTTANSALNALLPSQGGNTGFFLQTNGTDSSWASGGLAGTMPSAVSTTLVTTTSATTTFVTAITTSITMTATSAPAVAKCVLDMTSATAASVANARVTINGVSGGTVSQSLTTATTQHLTISSQNLSAALGPGTYTVNCDFARASGTGTVTVSQGSLNVVGLQGANTNGITQLTGALQAGPGSGSQVLSGILPIANGGTNSSSAAVNGAVVYSTAAAHAYTAAGTTGQILRSAGAASPTWTAETFPASTTINQILYSSAANVVSGLATTNTGALVTSSTGVPSLASGSTANRLLRTNGTTVSFAQANLATDVTGTLPFANGGTGTTAFANQRIPFSNGTQFVADANFIYDTVNNRFTVGGSGNARIGAVVASGSGTSLGLQAFCESTNNCLQIRNVNAYNVALLNANDSNALGGVLLGAERSRGTQTSRTQALSGDGELNLVGSCYTGAASSTGFTASIQYVLSENCTAGANGGEIVFNTTPNTTTALVERARITNDGQAKFHYGASIDTSTTQPTCDSSHRGLWWVIQGGAGVADILQICLKDAADVYNWVTK